MKRTVQPQSGTGNGSSGDRPAGSSTGDDPAPRSHSGQQTGGSTQSQAGKDAAPSSNGDGQSKRSTKGSRTKGVKGPKGTKGSGTGSSSGSGNGSGTGSSTGSGNGSGSGSGSTQPSGPVAPADPSGDDTPIDATDLPPEVPAAGTADQPLVLPTAPGSPTVLAGALSVPASGHGVGAGLGSHGSVTVSAAARPTAIGRLQRVILAAPLHQTSSDRRSETAAGANRDPQVLSPLHSDIPGVTGQMPGLAPVPASTSVVRSDATSTRSAAQRAQRPAASTGGHWLPVPSPFGPPGRDVVAAGSGISSSAAGSGAVCAILVGLLLLSLQPLRRFRLLPAAVGPAGYSSLQQRPG